MKLFDRLLGRTTIMVKPLPKPNTKAEKKGTTATYENTGMAPILPGEVISPIRSKHRPEIIRIETKKSENNGSPKGMPIPGQPIVVPDIVTQISPPTNDGAAMAISMSADAPPAVDAIRVDTSPKNLRIIERDFSLICQPWEGKDNKLREIQGALKKILTDAELSAFHPRTRLALRLTEIARLPVKTKNLLKQHLCLFDLKSLKDNLVFFIENSPSSNEAISQEEVQIIRRMLNYLATGKPTRKIKTTIKLADHRGEINSEISEKLQQAQTCLAQIKERLA